MPDPGHIPGPVVVPDCVAVTLHWTLPNGKSAHNALHGRVAGAAAIDTALANNILNSLLGDSRWTDYAAMLAATTTLVGIDLRDLRALDQPLVSSTIAGESGTGATFPAPANLSFVVTLRTALAGRANRGRAYLGGFDQVVVGAGGNATGNMLTRAPAFVQTVADAMDAHGLVMCIAHPARAEYTGESGAHHAARPAGTVDVTSILARNAVFDTQRKRAVS